MLACLTLMSVARPAIGATRKAVLERLCPDAIRAASLYREASEEQAVADPSADKTYKQAARLYYRCLEAVSDPESRDLALLDYATTLYISTRTIRDVLDFGPVLDAKLNELAYRTRFKDLRNTAQELRRDVRSKYREAYKTVYDHYPDDESASQPTSQPASVPQEVGPTVENTPQPCTNCPHN